MGWTGGICDGYAMCKWLYYMVWWDNYGGAMYSIYGTVSLSYMVRWDRTDRWDMGGGV